MVPVQQPSAQRIGHFVEMPAKEMVAGNKDDASRRNRFRMETSGEAFEPGLCGVLIVFPLNQQLGFCAGAQIVEREFTIVDRQPQADQFSHSGIPAAYAQTDPCAEAETRCQQRRAGKFRREVIERRADIVLFAPAMIVDSLTGPYTAKIETQNGNAQGIERLGGLIDDLVVHCALIKRMRVTDHGSQRNPKRFFWPPKDRFEPSRRAAKRYLFVVSVHS